MSKPITLDDLDRDELLALARHGLWSQRDLVWAQYEVSSLRARTAREASYLAWDRWCAACIARSQAFEAGRDRAIVKAMEAEIAASAAKDRADSKARRLEARKDRLWKLYEELPQ